MTKKDLIRILQMVYDNIPECTCSIEYTSRELTDPGCVFHYMYTEEEVDYIRIAVGNLAITNPLPLDPLIGEFTEASRVLFEWYDGERSIITEKGYTCPTPDGTHGMTMLRTVLHKAEERIRD